MKKQSTLCVDDEGNNKEKEQLKKLMGDSNEEGRISWASMKRRKNSPDAAGGQNKKQKL